MFDSAKLGQVAARCMESLETDEEVAGGTLDAVMIIVVASSEDDKNAVLRTYSSEREAWKQVGLIEMGRICVGRGRAEEE